MTTYGTFPTSSSPSTNLEFISCANQRIKAGLGTRRPWKVMFNFRSIGLPGGFSDAISRVRFNIGYFRVNYAIAVLLILFLSLLWHPISLIVSVLLMTLHPISLIVFFVLGALWLLLYFLLDNPLVIAGCRIDERVILIAMLVLTIVLLTLTNATLKMVLVALLIGAAFLVAHAAFRRTDDLFLHEEETSGRPV